MGEKMLPYTMEKEKKRKQREKQPSKGWSKMNLNWGEGAVNETAGGNTLTQ